MGCSGGGARPAEPPPSPPNLPQQCHVLLGVHRVAEDVALQGGCGLLEPQKQGVAGTQADLGRDGQDRRLSPSPAPPTLAPSLTPHAAD